MSFQPIPAPGFVLISGTRNAPDDGTEYHVQFRSGFCDFQNRYTARQLVWIHDFSTNPQGSGGDVVAIRRV